MTILLGSQCDVLTRQLGVAHLRRTEMLQCGVQVVGEVSDLRFERSHVFELSSTTTTRAFSVTQHASLASNIRGICTISRISVAVVLFNGVLRLDRLGGFPSTLRTTLRRGTFAAAFPFLRPVISPSGFSRATLSASTGPSPRRPRQPPPPPPPPLRVARARSDSPHRSRTPKKLRRTKRIARVHTGQSSRTSRDALLTHARERTRRARDSPSFVNPLERARIPQPSSASSIPGTRSRPPGRKSSRHDHLSQHIHRRHASVFHPRPHSRGRSSTARVRDQIIATCPSAPLDPQRPRSPSSRCNTIPSHSATAFAPPHSGHRARGRRSHPGRPSRVMRGAPQKRRHEIVRRRRAIHVERATTR